ncbi:XRE family transcriptional regulator [Porticoccaceae bacterium]|nr:XRE family transcriptional regulator [Porticoccaceae bacterium]MDC0003201.1 XRE family transcriptional regulator [Porticoccaceae bacterium]
MVKQKKTGKSTEQGHQANAIGTRLRELRKEHDWTLNEVARLTGISVGTLSKLEHGKTELNFTSVNKLAEGLGLRVTELTNPRSSTAGLRSITASGNGMVFNTRDVDYEVLCSDITGHQQGYLKVVVKAHELDPDMPWHRHKGQEFLYVLGGRVELHTELYAPLLLKEGDSILFDSSMGHHYVSRGRKDAEILIAMSLEGYQNVSDSLRSDDS